MAIRARSFAQLLDGCENKIFYRDKARIRAFIHFLRGLFQQEPKTVYVLDMAAAGVCAALGYALITRCKIIIDTGDAIGFLADSVKDRSWFGRKLTHFLELLSVRAANVLVVRSQNHSDYLDGQAKKVFVIPDGVDTVQFQPLDASVLRDELQIPRHAVVLGLLGSIVWNHQWDMCYGWDLVEALTKLRDLPVYAVIIGDGNGLDRLKQMACRLKLDQRILFLGRIRYEDLPRYLSLFDICLSTQTNDLAGQVRTSGKLPLYLSCGKHVLATDVGEAARILPSSMLLRYEGTKDSAYPTRLAQRIRELVESGDWAASASLSRSLARQNFDYSVFRPNLQMAIDCPD